MVNSHFLKSVLTINYSPLAKNGKYGYKSTNVRRNRRRGELQKFSSQKFFVFKKVGIFEVQERPSC